MTIAATRMYRGLDDFLSSDVYDNYVFLSSLGSPYKNLIVAYTCPMKVAAKSQSQLPGVPQPCQFRSMR
jgi:hypothetical protein